ncbi:uncharacterized protein [Typha latifolia]|uniref:uncharacterized protein n=1 Tax=Typha latifolia TaxID=4733 RepID=UPI003C2CCB08
MNHCGMQQNAFASCDEFANRKSPVFCPKPRRLGPPPPVVPVRPLRWHTSHQVDFFDSRDGSEVVDIFFPKGGEHNYVASSPPFFCGSPPSRAENPVVHDARFGADRPVSPVGPVQVVRPGSPMSPSGCARAKFGFKPATVRIEGFDCLGSRGRRGCGITAVA